METYTREEREKILYRMQVISNQFYRGATQAGCHAFIEFCGLMNEYIKICTEAHEAGIDFVMANTHSGNALPIQDHQIAYLAEKLDCIYGPMLASPEAKEKFLEAFLPKAAASIEASTKDRWVLLTYEENGKSEEKAVCTSFAALKAAARLLDCGVGLMFDGALLEDTAPTFEVVSQWTSE